MRTYDAHELAAPLFQESGSIGSIATRLLVSIPAAPPGAREIERRQEGFVSTPCPVVPLSYVEAHMHFERVSFGLIRIDGVSYEHDVVIDRGKVRKRKKKASKRFRDLFGHTPLSVEEEIPWKCRRLVIGTGSGALPCHAGSEARSKASKG